MVRARASKSEPAIDFDGLIALCGFQIGIVHSIISTKLEAKLKVLGLSPKLASVVWLANANPGISQVTLTRLFGVQRTTVNVYVRELTGKGLIMLEQSQSDRRSFGIYLTEAGKETLPKVKKIVLRFEREFADVAGENNVAMLSMLLENLRVKSLELAKSHSPNAFGDLVQRAG